MSFSIHSITSLLLSLIQAERQAVNTTVQGSAADIVKLATVNIQKRLRQTYPAAPLSHQHTHPGDYFSCSWYWGTYHFKVFRSCLMMLSGVYHTASNHRRAARSQIRGAYFVLQLHDELIYETTEEDLIQVLQLLFLSVQQLLFFVLTEVSRIWNGLDVKHVN